MKKHLLLLFVLALGSNACGQSPLLNHDSAGDAGRDAPQLLLHAADQGDCPLALTAAHLCAQLTWTKTPNENETGAFELDFWDPAHATKSGPYIDPAQTLAVKLWMPAMGHGSSPVAIAKKVDGAGVALPGQFDVTNVFFVMPGAWEIHVQLKNGSSVVDEVVVPVQI